MLAMLQNLADVENNPPPEEWIPPPAPAANTATNNVKFEILRNLQEIQNGNADQGGRGGRGCRGDGNRNRNRRTPDDAAFNGRITNLYYHTHGRCNHNSSECTKKAADHNDAAIMNNRLGGSNAVCQPVAGAVE